VRGSRRGGGRKARRHPSSSPTKFHTTPFTFDEDLRDGADVSAIAYSGSAFWESLSIEAPEPANRVFWNFSVVWQWKEGFLPILRGAGGEQNPTVQPLP